MKGIEMIAYRNAEKFIRELMLMRRCFELLDLDVKEYDKKLQTLTEEYHKGFSEMGMGDMMVVMQAAMGEMEQPEQKLGEWEERYVDDENPFFRKRYYCSVCGDWNTYGKPEYCPNCGARMKRDR